MIKLIRRSWKYLTAKLTGQFNEMADPTLMNVYKHPLICPPTSISRMIKVDVCDKHHINQRWVKVMFFECL